MQDNSSGGQQAGITKRTGRFGEDQDPNVGKDTQFRSGASGNPKGRPKGIKSLSTAIQEMMDDPSFIDRLNDKIKDKFDQADPQFQGTPMKAIITTALIEAMDPMTHPMARGKARDWLRKAGYGDKVDITSGGERIQQAPIVVSDIAARGAADATAQAETS